jgi:hypothetical protein
MAAPAALGTGAEPDQPGLYLGDDPKHDLYPDYPDPPGRRMGVLGFIVLAVAVLAVVAAVYAIINHGFKPKTRLTYHPAAVFNLQAGDCFNGQNGLGVTAVPCSSPHEAEVFATFPLSITTWPGDDAVQAAAQAGCQTRIAGYMNPQLATEALSQEFIYPDQVTWTSGVRTVVCAVRSDNGPITGSVRQAPASSQPAASQPGASQPGAHPAVPSGA